MVEMFGYSILKCHGEPFGMPPDALCNSAEPKLSTHTTLSSLESHPVLSGWWTLQHFYYHHLLTGWYIIPIMFFCGYQAAGAGHVQRGLPT